VAIGTWRSAGDPSVYGMVDMDVGPALAYLEKIRAATGERLTLTHFVGKAVAMTLARHPQINCILRMGRLYPRRNVDVFFQVASDETGQDLSGMTIRNADRKSIPELAREMATRVHSIRKQGDPEFKKMKGTMGLLPGFVSRYILGLAGFIMYTLNLWSPLLGSPRDPFGSVMVTNIGSLGLDMAYAPLVPYSRVPLLIAVGTARQAPVVKDGQLAVGTLARLCVTIDHRLIDGVHASHMARTINRIFINPEAELGPV
jgi:pyruvate dehydrogenase E2 component (dihydrolipoamide acetyltransferase)